MKSTAHIFKTYKMVFIELTTRSGNKALINVNNITNIIDLSSHTDRKDDENTRIYTNDADYTAVKETYEDIKEKLNDSCEYGLVIKMDQK